MIQLFEDKIPWLKKQVFKFFPNSAFEIESLFADNEKEDMLAVIIYDSLDASEFRNRRHKFCESIEQAGEKDIYMALSIFQRRVQSETFSSILKEA